VHRRGLLLVLAFQVLVGDGVDARGEGFTEIADWLETLAKAERSHANRFQKALDALAD